MTIYRFDGTDSGVAISPLGFFAMTYPSPVPAGLSLQMVATYMDEDGDRQSVTANNTTTPMITGVTPLQVWFDATGSRSVATDADDEAGAWANMSYRFDAAGATPAGNWSLTGKPKNRIEGPPKTFFMLEEAGTHTITLTVVDREGRQGSITITAVLTAPGAGTNVGAGGSWPTITDKMVLRLERGVNHTAKGTLSLAGREGVRIEPFGEGAAPIVSRIDFDDRYEEASPVQRTRNCTINGINVGIVGESLIGQEFCAVLNHPGTFYYAPSTQSLGWQVSTANQTIRDNMAFPVGMGFWNCAGITCWPDNYVFIHFGKYWGFRNCVLDKNTGDAGQHVLRGGWDTLDLRGNLLENTAATSSYAKITGWDNGPKALPVIDAWPVADRYGVWNGAPYKPLSRYILIEDNDFGSASSASASQLLIEAMPENDDEGSEVELNQYVSVINNRFYYTPGETKYVGFGAKDVLYYNNKMNSGAGAEIEYGTNLRTNRLPDGWGTTNNLTTARPAFLS